MKALGAQLADLQRTMDREVSALNERAAALNADYAATPDQAKELARSYADQRRTAFARYRDLVFAMRREVTAAEWKEISK